MDSDRRPLGTWEALCSALSAGFDVISRSLPDLEYRLVGTAAARLQGVELPVGDIDLLVRQRSDVDAVGHALKRFPCLVAPTALEYAPQYYACYDVNGGQFSVSTLEVGCDEDGWECKGPSPWQHYVEVVCGGHRIKCVSLELRLGTEFARGRVDRYEPILRHLHDRGADRHLLDQVSRARMLPAGVQSLLSQLPPSPAK